MAAFTPSKKTAEDFNNGVEYINGDGVETGDVINAETINNVVESQLWTQALATNPVDNSEADNVGTASVELTTMANGTPRIKVKNIKGRQGAQGIQGVKGDKGNGIAKTTVTYATSTSGTTIPADSAWKSTIPTVAKGSYLWTRTVITNTDGTSSTSYSSAYQGLDGTGAVTGVKGNVETQYRTGNVNLTAENIGAASTSGLYPNLTAGKSSWLVRNLLNSSDNLDEIRDEGYYYWSNSQPANSPCTYATMEVRFASSSSWAKQIVYRQGSKTSNAASGQYTSEEIYIRSRDDNWGWTDWILIPTVGYNNAHYLQLSGVLPVNSGGTGIKFDNIATPGGLVTAPSSATDTYHTKAWGTSGQYLNGVGNWASFTGVSRHGATTLTNQNLDSFNNEGTTGWYYAGGSNTVQNKPSGVDAFGLEVIRVAQGYYAQRLTSHQGVEYARYYNASIWTAWTNTLLKAYPVGSIYMSIKATSPASLFGGTWTRIAQNRVLMGQITDSTLTPNYRGAASATETYGIGDVVSSGGVCYICLMSGANGASLANTAQWKPHNVAEAGYTLNAGLPNINGRLQFANTRLDGVEASGCFEKEWRESGGYMGNNAENDKRATINFFARNSSTIYGESNSVQPNATVVYMWQRTA